MALKGKWTRTEVEYELEYVFKHLKEYKKICVCGSWRRGLKVMGDIDFVIVPLDLAKMTLSVHDMAKKVLASGEKKIRIILPTGIQADFMITTPKLFGSAILHSTGSKFFNIKCRTKAKEMGYKLNEYGLHREDGTWMSSGEKRILDLLQMKEFTLPERRCL